MKHILICAICTVLLFGYIGRSTMSESSLVSMPTGNAVTRVAVAATTQAVQKEAEEPEKPAVMQVGILLGHGDDLGTIRFKNALEKALPQDNKVSVVDAVGSADTQKTMFDKMVDSGYNVIIIELMDSSPAEELIDKAGQAGVPLIVFGREPSLELLTRYPMVYYIGFSGEDLAAMLANETFAFWQSNPTMMNFEKDEWDLSYSAITSTGFEESGLRAQFDAAIESLGLSTQFEVDSIVRHYDYDLHKEVDQTIIKDSEIVFYDSSTELQKVINYFYDPTEFSRRPKQQLALMVIDDGASKLVEEGEALFACGTDTRELGMLASRLSQLLMAGQTPSFQSVEIEPVNERCFYLPYTVIHAAIEPEPVEEPETAG